MPLQTKVEQFAKAVLAKQWQVAVAESCTGGGLAYELTSIAGSSQWFDRGFITYSDQAKQDLLGVSTTTLAQQGAVSLETAAEMVEGVIKHSQAQLAVSITGIAGPSGGSVEKPVGLVCFGVSSPTKTYCKRYVFAGDRESVRRQAIEYALDLLLVCVAEK